MYECLKGHDMVTVAERQFPKDTWRAVLAEMRFAGCIELESYPMQYQLPKGVFESILRGNGLKKDGMDYVYDS